MVRTSETISSGSSERNPVAAVRGDDVPALRRQPGQRLLLSEAVIARIGHRDGDEWRSP